MRCYSVGLSAVTIFPSVVIHFRSSRPNTPPVYNLTFYLFPRFSSLPPYSPKKSTNPPALTPSLSPTQTIPSSSGVSGQTTPISALPVTLATLPPSHGTPGILSKKLKYAARFNCSHTCRFGFFGVPLIWHWYPMRKLQVRDSERLVCELVSVNETVDWVVGAPAPREVAEGA